MAEKSFWNGFNPRTGLKLDDKILLGNSDSGETEYTALTDVRNLLGAQGIDFIGKVTVRDAVDEDEPEKKKVVDAIKGDGWINETVVSNNQKIINLDKLIFAGNALTVGETGWDIDDKQPKKRITETNYQSITSRIDAIYKLGEILFYWNGADLLPLDKTMILSAIASSISGQLSENEFGFNTSTNLLGFFNNGFYVYFTPSFKATYIDKDTGVNYIYNGTTLEESPTSVSLETSVETLENQITTALGTKFDFVEEVGLVRYDFTESDTATDFRKTPIIAVEPYQVIEVDAMAKTTAGTLACVFYDQWNNPKSSITLTVLGTKYGRDSDGYNLPFVLQIPASIYGFKVCRFTDSSRPLGIRLLVDNSELVTRLEGNESFYGKYTAPRKLLAFAYNENVQNLQFNLFQEALVDNTLLDFNINGSLYASYNKIAGIGSNKTQDRLWYPVLSKKGYVDTTLTIPVTDVNITNGVNADLRVMMLGSSNVQYGYAIHAKKLANRLNIDLGNINLISVGTKHSIYSVVDEYKGQNNDIDKNDFFCAGYAGHAQGDILRHIVQVQATGTSDAYHLAGKRAWDSLGLGTMTRLGVPGRSYVAFDDTDKTHYELLNETCHCWYDADPTPELWDWICVSKSMAGQSFIYNSITYTFGTSYSTSDNDAQIAYIKYLGTTGDYISFFDFDTVQASNNSHAFNLTAYLNNYRTMTDAGERLYFNNTGSTTGTAGAGNAGWKDDGVGGYELAGVDIGIRISDTINEGDVCEPKFTPLTLGSNESRAYPDPCFTSEEAASKVVVDTLLLGSLIKSHNSAINVGMGFYHLYGVINPSRWTQFGNMRQFYPDNWTQELHNLINKKIQTELFDNGEDANYSWMPIYYSQNVIGAPSIVAFDANTQREIIHDNGADSVHAIDGGWDGTAQAVLAWIFSLL